MHEKDGCVQPCVVFGDVFNHSSPLVYLETTISGYASLQVNVFAPVFFRDDQANFKLPHGELDMQKINGEHIYTTFDNT